MKKTIFTTIVAICMAFFSFANDFEGIIVQSYYDGASNQSIEMEWYISGNEIKLVMNGGGEEITFLTKDEQMIVLSERQVTEDGQSYFYRLAASEIKTTINTDINAIILDEEKLLNDVEIEVGGSVNGTITYNTAIDISMDYFGSFFKSNYEFLILANLNIDQFPVSSQLKNSNGVLISYIETTSIVEEKLAEEEFAIPADMIDADTLNE
ncbi:MAG: hypothetical protein ACPG4Z_05425 [Chitinophagales bacterium]